MAVRTGSLGSVELESAIVIRAGVGSRGWGISESGTEATRGGFGEVLGDQGSAYWIGRWGASAALKALEKRSRNTLLRDRLLEHFKAESYRELLGPEYDPRALDRYAIAGFAEQVFAAAREDDELSIQILDEAGRELANMVLALINELDFIDTPFTVLPCGSVFRMRGNCLEAFMKVLKTKTAKVTLVKEGPGAAAGGVLLAIQHLGLTVRPETSAALQASLQARDT